MFCLWVAILFAFCGESWFCSHRSASGRPDRRGAHHLLMSSTNLCATVSSYLLFSMVILPPTQVKGVHSQPAIAQGRRSKKMPVENKGRLGVLFSMVPRDVFFVHIFHFGICPGQASFINDLGQMFCLPSMLKA